MLFSRPLQAASAAASRTRRRTWLGSTALLASLAVTAAPSGAWAVCSGVDTGTVLCDAANPSGGSLDTTAVFLGSTVDINAGAGINTGVALGAAAVVTVAVGGDVTFNLTDPAGISSTVAGSSAIFLDSINAGPGRITYNGSSNVTSAATGIKILASGGGNVIRQSAGVVTGAANAIDVSQIDQWFVGFVTVDTVGSQINGNISVASNAAVTITTGAVAGGIHIEEYGFAGIGDILITTNGAINNLSGQAIVFNTRSFSPTTGSITLTANATVKGDIDLEQTHASATAPVTVTLNQGVTSNIIVSNAGSGATTVSTQGIDGSLTVESSGHLNTTVNGNINAVGGAAGAFGASITGPGDMNVAINGAVSATGTGVAVATAAGAFVNSAGISASGHTRIFNASGDVTAMATSTGAAGSATAIGAGASSNGSATLEATFSGAVSATAIASGAGATADATGVRTGVGNGGTGDVKLLLNGPVTATATAGNAGTASAVGIQALFMGGGSGNLNVTANDMVLANASDGPGQAIGILALDFNNVASTTAMTFIVNKDVSAAGSINAIGIAAAQGPSGLGGVSFDVMGSVTATASAGGAGGIQASIANAANPNTMAIRVGGDVIASGQAGLGFGIMASSAGIGDIVIDVMGAVRSTGVGISASRTAAGNIFINADSVTGTTGVATSGGTATVVIGSSVTGTDGIAVQLGGTSDILRLLGTSITGSVIGTGTSILQLGGTNSAKFDSSLGGFASVASFAGSNWTLNGNSSFAGPINVDGVLAVNGLIPNAAVVVGANGTLAGTGAVGNVTMNGGTLSPGNSPGTLTMTSLTMTAATTYLVQVQGAVSDRIVVTGNANIAGALIVTPLTRQVQRTTYTIASAGSLNGTFNSMVLTNNFARNAVLSYVGNDVLLTLDPSLLSPILPGAASTNQRNVAGAIDAALLGGSSMTDAFSAIFALSGNGLLNGLTQLSGETATGSQQTTFNAMNLFLNVMTDPFIAGRGDGANIPGAAPGFADEEALAYAARKRNPNDALAAIYAKAPPVAPFQQRWSVWAAGYGGSQTTDGNTVVGSNTTTSRVYGTAVGADYRFSPFTIAGFSLAGGGTNFSVANNGAGRSDLFQAGAFIRHNFGAAYLSGALAYGWQDITTDRTVTVAGIDRLRAQFNANAWSGRVESGYRFVAPVIGGIGFTPYAAGQFTTFELPAYAESVVSGANTFALAYGARSVTATRSELGLRTDRSFAMQSAILTLRGRLAWAHDFNPSRGIGATFQTLPGASFFVNGAAQASDSALVTASAETKWMNGWSTAATFEGEFSNVTRSYAGKGVVRYAW